MADGRPTPTRIAWLELADERRTVREGYELLDEKRMLLAAEIMKSLRLYRGLRRRWLEALAAAREALAAATGRHGFEGLWAYPPGTVEHEELRLARRGLLGLSLVEAELGGGEPLPAFLPPEPSPEAEATAVAFRELLRQAAVIAALECSLRRMAREYVRTERRARALENVLLPEIDRDLHFVEAQLEGVDQEEAVRVREARGGPHSTAGQGRDT